MEVQDGPFAILSVIGGMGVLLLSLLGVECRRCGRCVVSLLQTSR